MARESRNESEDLKTYAPHVTQTYDREYVSPRCNHNATPLSEDRMKYICLGNLGKVVSGGYVKLGRVKQGNSQGVS